MRKFDDKAYDTAYLLRTLVWIGVTSIAMRLTTGTISVIFPLVAVSALVSGNMARLFFLFMLMIGAQVGNTFFFPKTFVYILSVRATLFLLALMLMAKLAGNRHSRFVSPFMGLLPYLLWECISSGQGYAPMVSYLKLSLFSVIFFSYYAIANATASDVRMEPRKIRSIILAFACLFILGSIVLIPFPGISLMSTADWSDPNKIIYLESLYKGMSMHSQSLGPLVAAFSVLVFGDFLFSVRKMDKLYLAILIACPILIWKTSSRTALGTYMAGMMVTAWFMMRTRNVGARWKGKVLSALLMIVIALSICVMAVPRAREGALRFVLKKWTSSEKVMTSDVSFENVASTRLGALDECMRNFRKKPLLGNGFQVMSRMEGEHRSGLLAYLSAPIEKGVWYAAVLEEGGTVGFVIFVLFLSTTFFALVKRHAYISASCFFSMVLSNLGEFTFFSMTSTGGLIWAMVFAAAILDSQRVAQAQREMMMTSATCNFYVRN